MKLGASNSSSLHQISAEFIVSPLQLSFSFFLCSFQGILVDSVLGWNLRTFLLFFCPWWCLFSSSWYLLFPHFSPSGGTDGGYSHIHFFPLWCAFAGASFPQSDLYISSPSSTLFWRMLHPLVFWISLLLSNLFLPSGATYVKYTQDCLLFSYVSLFLLSPHIVVLLTSYFSPVSISVHTDYSFLFHFRFYLESCFLSSFFLSNLLLGAPFFNFFYVSPLLCLLTLPYPFTWLSSRVSLK